MKHVIGSLIVTLAVTLAAPVQAASLIGGTDLDAFCEGRTGRSTVLYIDTRTVDPDNVAWAERLIEALMVNLSPHEPVTVVALNTVDATTSKVWSSCYPGLWPGEEHESGGFFSASTKEKLDEARKKFRRRLTKAVEKVIVDKRTSTSADEAARIVRALMTDTARVVRTEAPARILVYSDFVEASEYGDVKAGNGAQRATKIADRLNADFANAAVYGFGVGLNESVDVRESAKTYFDSFFDTANAHVMRLSQEVALPGQAPVDVRRYGLSGNPGDRKLTGELVLMADEDGRLQDSYVSFNGKVGSPIRGSFQCDGETCRVEAKTVEATLTEDPDERIQLDGKPSQMSGFIGWPDHTTPDGREATVQLTARAEEIE